MKLIAVTQQIKNLFSGILQCEFCNNHQPLVSGVDDEHYHDNVIPEIRCQKCRQKTNPDKILVATVGKKQ